MDPITGKAIGAATKAALTGLEALRSEFARRRGNADFLAGTDNLDEVLDEALDVLASDADGIRNTLKTKLKSLLSRPALLANGPARDWIATREARTALKQMARAIIQNEPTEPFVGAVEAHYAHFLTGADGEPDARDIIEEALDFLLRSVTRNLSVEAGANLAAIAGLSRKIDSLAPPDTSDLVDERIERRLKRARQSRFFRSGNIHSEALELGAAIASGRLRAASPQVRAVALAWCARFLAFTEHADHARHFLKLASELPGKPTEIARVASALLAASPDYRAGLKLLDADASPMQATATLQILRHGLGTAQGLERAVKAGLEPERLDSDGRYVLIVSLVELDRWTDALEVAQTLSEEDFETTPALTWIMAILLVADRAPEDLRPLLQQVPNGPASFPLGSDSASLNALRLARNFMLRAARTCAELDLPTEAAAAERYAAWLRLRDPKEQAAALAELRASMAGPDSLAWFPLALGFGLEVDIVRTRQAIERELARNPEPSFETAGAMIALLLHFVSHDPAAGARFLAEYRSQFALFLEQSGMRELEARLATGDGPGSHLPALPGDGLAGGRGGRPGSDLAALEEAYARDPSTLNVLALLEAYLEQGENSDRLVELASAFLVKVPDRELARHVVRHLGEQGRDADALTILSLVGDAVSTSEELLAHAAWLNYRLGNFKDALNYLNELDGRRDLPADRNLRFQLLVASGAWEALDAFIEQQWDERASRSGLELAQLAQIAAGAGAKRAPELARLAVERDPQSPAVLAASYGALTTAGREEEIPEAIGWIMRAAELSGDDGPVKQASIKEIVDQAPRWNAQVDEAMKAYAAGSLPIEVVGKMLRRPALELALAPIFANRHERDVRKHVMPPLFSGRQRSGNSGAHDWSSVALDTPAIVTLAAMGTLDRVLDAFRAIHVRHDLLTELFLQMGQLAFHQPSRTAFARTLLELVARGSLQMFETRLVPDIALVTDIGERDAAMLFDAANQPGNDTYFVHPYPMPRAGTLLAEQVELEEYRGTIVSCSAVVDALHRHGRMRADEKASALEYLALQEQRWPTEPRIRRGARLYLNDLAVAYLRRLGLLERLPEAGLTGFVGSSELGEAKALLELEAVSSDVERVVNDLRATIAPHVASGKVRFDAACDDEAGVQALASLARKSPLLVSDDRFVNRFEYFELPDSKTRLLSSIDLLEELAEAEHLQAQTLASVRTRLREGGAVYVPLDKRELEDHVAAALVEPDDTDRPALVETNELRALRENIRLAQARGWIDPEKDAAWIVATNRTVADAILAQWRDGVAEEIAVARSDWLMRLMSLVDWSETIVPPRLQNLGKFGRILEISRLAPNAPMLGTPHGQAFNRWFDDRVVKPFLAEEPRLREPMLDHLRAFIRGSAEDLASARAGLGERDAGRLWFEDLSPTLQGGLLDDRGFEQWIGYTRSTNVEIGSASFDQDTLFAAVRALYADPERVRKVTDKTNRTWTLKTEPGAQWAIWLKSGKTDYRIRGIVGLHPTPESRVAMLDDLLQANSVAPSALRKARQFLSLAEVSPRDIAEIDAAIKSLPPFAAQAITENMRDGSCPHAILVPRSLDYYERLVGPSTAATLKDLLEDPARTALDWVLANPVDRAAWLLLRASQPQLLKGSELDDLGSAGRAALGKWLRRRGDLLSKVGFVEQTVHHAHEDPALEEIILGMLGDIAAADPEDAGGPFQLLSSLAIFIDAELVRHGTLAEWPPFRRRQAVLAHASLIARMLAEETDTEDFAEPLLNEGGWRFGIQNLMDLRIEPRWRPELISPQQLRYECVGRLRAAVLTLDEQSPTKRLRDCFQGKKGTFEKEPSLRIFWPGPLEGSDQVTLQELPDALLEGIEELLAKDPLTFKEVAALINSEPMFALPESLVEAFIARVQETGPRLFGDLDAAQISSFLLGLANIAASQRRPLLADIVQLLARQHRARAEVPIQDEMHIALTACASLADEEAWRRRVGGWVLELAANIDDRDQAERLFGWIKTMGEIDPELRANLGRAHANLCLFLGR